MKPIANVSMLIRHPPSEVFNAFLDPAVLKRFWLSRPSARLAPGVSAQWEFMVPGVIAETRVREMTSDRCLVLEWPDDETAEFTFEERPDGHTRLEIRSTIKGKNDQDAMEKTVEATQGYTIVVCNLKALLETGRTANLVEDKATLITEKMKAS